MALEWTQDLSTDSDEIDNQHKELFRRINSLLDACNQGKGREEVGKTLQFLEDYVITHFSAEEEYMQRYNYHGYSTHKAQHLGFIKDFTDLKKQLQEEGPAIQVIIRTNHLLVDWILNHIRRIDKTMGAFLKTKIDM